MQVHCIALLALVPATVGSIFPVSTGLTTQHNSHNSVLVTIAGKVGNESNAIPKLAVDARRRGTFRKRRRSTSSSSGERVMSGHVKDSEDSLGISSSSKSSSETDKDQTPDGRGWRKWHRQCTPCPADMAKKWRDPTIKWICGGYQRARRTFKSECMMYYRNCQDGTMFVKIHDYRCNDQAPGYNGGKHFLYDYWVALPDDTSGKSSETDHSASSSSSLSKSISE